MKARYKKIYQIGTHLAFRIDMKNYERLMSRNFFFLLLLLLLTGAMQAQPVSKQAGTASNIFLRMDQSASVSALSGAYCAVAGDENTLFYNPAGLANINKGALALNHTQWFEDIRIDNLVFGYNFDRKLGVAFSISHLWMPAIQGRDYLGQNTDEINVSSSFAILGLGYKVHPSFYAGLAIKYFSDNLSEYKASGLAIDAGIFMYLMVPGLSFGASVQNFGSKLQYDTAKESLPFSYRAGLAYNIPRIGVRISADAVKSKDTDYYYAAGMEYTFAKTFSLRAGNQFRSWEQFNPVYGAGLNIQNRYVFDYTFSSNSTLGTVHRVGFTFRFNIPATRVTYKPVFYQAKKTIHMAPQNVAVEIKSGRLMIQWSKVESARYNVYARTSQEKSYKKLNRHPLYSTTKEFKQPQGKKTIYVVVTSVIDGAESAFSKEAKLDVK
jgi:hypothetical protein